MVLLDMLGTQGAPASPESGAEAGTDNATDSGTGNGTATDAGKRKP